MSITQIYYTSRKLAESLAGDPAMAIISITDPTTPAAQLDPLFQHVLRLSFFDAIPADPFAPPLPGLFDRATARRVKAFIEKLQHASEAFSLMVHCEYGVSRSAAIALYAEACTGAPLAAREFTYEANSWVIDTLENLQSDLSIHIPPPQAALERRAAARA